MDIALPFRLGLAQRHDFPAYPPERAAPAEPVTLPWGLKPLGSAECGAERLSDGRLSYWIRHDIVKGVTPRMLVWWFSHLEGDMDVAGQRIARYRVWHPYDHVHASYARRRPDGSIGPGAAIRLREFLGADPRFDVDVVTDIEQLDEQGFVHHPRVHGVSGLARMEYRFTRVAEGTLYENRILVGAARGWRRALSPVVERWAFDAAHGRAWLRHNVEEVGAFEHFLPPLYRRETGLST